MKKGFTLIELLAVIVILAIIALIASPIIKGLIDNARKETLKSSTYGIIRAGEIFYNQDMINEATEEVVFTYTEGEESNVDDMELDYNGQKPKSGEVKVNANGEVALAIHNGKHCAEKGYDDSEVTISNKKQDECVISSEPPEETQFFEKCGDFLYDERDKKSYPTVEIKNQQGDNAQCWMAANLKYTADDGEEGTDKDCLKKTFSSSTTNACRKATEALLSEYNTYRDWLQHEVWYQWGVANTACPPGWRLPSDDDLIKLYNNVGDEVGDKLKSSDPNYCFNKNVEVCAIYDFNGLPTGRRNSGSNSFYSVGNHGSWWTSSLAGVKARYFELDEDESSVYGFLETKDYGYPVRCILGE